MKNKDKLITLLKSCPEVKEAMEQLEFGTHILGNMFDENFEYIDDTQIEELIFVREVDKGLCSSRLCITNKGNSDIYNIIGLPLQERFIRMYCESKRIKYFMIRSGELEFEENKSSHIKIDNSKDFSEQDDIVYGKILEALKA